LYFKLHFTGLGNEVMADQADDKRERFSFWALMVISAALGLSLSVIGLWVPGVGALMDAPPNQGESFALTLSNGLLGVVQALGIVALCSKRVKFWPALLLTIAIFPTSYIVPGMDYLLGKQSHFVRDVDDVFRFGSLLVMGLLLSFPWMFRSMAWPHRSAGHLATGLALLAIMVLQGVFHLGLVWSGWGFRDARIAETQMIIEQTASSAELARLGELNILPLEVVTKDNLPEVLAEQRAAYPEGKEEGIRKLWEDAPDTLFVWPLHGYSERDTFFIIYDGRDDAVTWLIPTKYFNEQRLYSVATMFFLSGVSMGVWSMMALIVARAHLLRQSRSQRQDERVRTPSAATIRRRRLTLIVIGGIGLVSPLLMNGLDLAVGSYLILMSAASCLMAGASSKFWPQPGCNPNSAAR
jgi:hypothetical protein